MSQDRIVNPLNRAANGAGDSSLEQELPNLTGLGKIGAHEVALRPIGSVPAITSDDSPQSEIFPMNPEIHRYILDNKKIGTYMFWGSLIMCMVPPFYSVWLVYQTYGKQASVYVDGCVGTVAGSGNSAPVVDQLPLYQCISCNNNVATVDVPDSGNGSPRVIVIAYALLSSLCIASYVVRLQVARVRAAMLLCFGVYVSSSRRSLLCSGFMVVLLLLISIIAQQAAGATQIGAVVYQPLGQCGSCSTNDPFNPGSVLTPSFYTTNPTLPKTIDCTCRSTKQRHWIGAPAHRNLSCRSIP
jgi:hypothetical protein